MKRFLLVVLCLVHAVVYAQDVVLSNYVGLTSGSQFEEYDPQITISNVGIVGVTKMVEVAVYLSTDNVWQSSDTHLVSIYSSSLSLGAGKSEVADSTGTGTRVFLCRVTHAVAPAPLRRRGVWVAGGSLPSGTTLAPGCLFTCDLTDPRTDQIFLCPPR